MESIQKLSRNKKVKKRKKYQADSHDNFQLAGESTIQKYVAAERFYAGKQLPGFSFSSSFENNLTEFMTGHRKLMKEQQASGKRIEEEVLYIKNTSIILSSTSYFQV
jgi:hypothetical protein